MGKQKTLTVKQPKLVDPVIGDDDKSISTASKGTNDLFANLEAQILKALSALYAHEKKAKKTKKNTSSLLEEGEESADNGSAIWLTVGLLTPADKSTHKPIKITIEYPWKKASDEQLSVCLICKDPQREYKTKVGSLSLGSVKKIIGISKLKLKYKPFEAKRQLCDLYDVFIADDRILPLLPKALGKTFFAKKKLPIPVSLDKTGEALKRELVGSIEATTLNLNTGSCLSIKVGQIHQDVPHVVKNVMTVIKEVIEKVPGKASNVRSLHLKTGESVALPVFLRQQQQ